KGLRGAGDRDGDGKVGIAELFEYVAEAVERDAHSVGSVQRPWSSSIGPGGVYLSSPRHSGERREPSHSRPTILAAIERLWREQGTAAALPAIEQSMEGAN